MLSASKAKEISELHKDVEFKSILDGIKLQAEQGATDSFQWLTLNQEERLKRLGYNVFPEMYCKGKTFSVISWK